jgi:hypothetical protein
LKLLYYCLGVSAVGSFFVAALIFVTKRFLIEIDLDPSQEEWEHMEEVDEDPEDYVEVPDEELQTTQGKDTPAPESTVTSRPMQDARPIPTEN